MGGKEVHGLMDTITRTKEKVKIIVYHFICLFDLILYIPSTIFQLNRDGSSWVEQVLS